MAQELIYTSVPQGLMPGRKGYCTVAVTRGMPDSMMRQLESLSAYRHIHQAGSTAAAANPVVYNHLTMEDQGRTLSLLSRISDAPLDYSGRSNYLAHHLVLTPPERADSGPAVLLRSPQVMATSWTGEPHYLESPRQLPAPAAPSGPLQGCQRLGLDPGWAGELARLAQDSSTAVAHVVVSTDMNNDLLTLLEDASSLLSPQVRWRFTFTTYFTGLPPNVDCCLRCVIDGTSESESARNNPQIPCVDLTRPGELPFPDHPLVQAARCGQRFQHAPAAGPVASAKPPSSPGAGAWSPEETGALPDEMERMLLEGTAEPASAPVGGPAPPIPMGRGAVPAPPVASTPALPPGVERKSGEFDFEDDDLEPVSRRRETTSGGAGWIVMGGVLVASFLVVGVIVLLNSMGNRSKAGPKQSEQVVDLPDSRPEDPHPIDKGSELPMPQGGVGENTNGGAVTNPEEDPPMDNGNNEPDKPAPPEYKKPSFVLEHDKVLLEMEGEPARVSLQVKDLGSSELSAKDLRLAVVSKDNRLVDAFALNDGQLSESGQFVFELGPKNVTTSEIGIDVQLRSPGPDGKLGTGDDLISSRSMGVAVKEAPKVDIGSIDSMFPPVAFGERVIAKKLERGGVPQVEFRVGQGVRNEPVGIASHEFGEGVTLQFDKPRLLASSDGDKKEPVYIGKFNKNQVFLPNRTVFAKYEDLVMNQLVIRSGSGHYYAGYSGGNESTFDSSALNRNEKTKGGFFLEWHPSGGVEDTPLRVLRDQKKWSSANQLVVAGKIEFDQESVSFGRHRWPAKTYAAKNGILIRIAADTCIRYQLETSWTAGRQQDGKTIPSEGDFQLQVHLLRVSEKMTGSHFETLQASDSELLTVDLVGGFDAAVNEKKVSVETIRMWATRIGFGFRSDEDAAAETIKNWFESVTQATAPTQVMNELATAAAPAGLLENEFRAEAKSFWRILKTVLASQRQFDSSPARLTAQVCRVAAFPDPKSKDELSFVYVPLAELSSPVTQAE